MEVEYSKSEYRGGHKFGRGTRYKIQQLGREKTLEEIVEETQLVGWSHGCPITRELTSPNSPYSPEWMLERYASVNEWFTSICNIAQKTNPSLYRLLRRSVPRFPDEPVGKHEPFSVPLRHLTHIVPMDMPWGYASPRLPIEIIRLGGNKVDKTEQAYSIMTDAIQHSQTPRQLLTILSEKVILAGVDPINVLEHTLAAGILQEVNCRREYIHLAEELERNAPTVMNVYINLGSAEKTKLEIAEIPFL